MHLNRIFVRFPNIFFFSSSIAAKMITQLTEKSMGIMVVAFLIWTILPFVVAFDQCDVPGKFTNEQGKLDLN